MLLNPRTKGSAHTLIGVKFWGELTDYGEKLTRNWMEIVKIKIRRTNIFGGSEKTKQSSHEKIIHIYIQESIYVNTIYANTI